MTPYDVAVIGANIGLFVLGMLVLLWTQDSYSSKRVKLWGKIVVGLMIVPPFLKLYLFAIL